MGTLFVSLVLLGVVALAVRYLMKQRKKGVCAGCSQCGDGGGCPHGCGHEK